MILRLGDVGSCLVISTSSCSSYLFGIFSEKHHEHELPCSMLLRPYRSRMSTTQANSAGVLQDWLQNRLLLLRLAKVFLSYFFATFEMPLFLKPLSAFKGRQWG